MIFYRSTILALVTTLGLVASAQSSIVDDDEVFSDACQASYEQLVKDYPEFSKLQADVDVDFTSALDFGLDPTAPPNPDSTCSINEEDSSVNCAGDLSTTSAVVALVEECNSLGDEGAIFFLSFDFDCVSTFIRVVIDLKGVPLCVPSACYDDLSGYKFDPSAFVGDDDDDDREVDVLEDNGDKNDAPNCTLAFSIKNKDGEVVVDENGPGPAAAMDDGDSKMNGEKSVGSTDESDGGSEGANGENEEGSGKENGGGGGDSSAFATSLSYAFVASFIVLVLVG